MSAWVPPVGWVIPSLPRSPKWSPYTAHYSAGPAQIEGNVRVLCDEWLRVSLPSRPRPETPYCLACAHLMPRGPVQLDMLKLLEGGVLNGDR